MAITDLNYHSYFSVFTGVDSDSKTAPFVPFKEGNYPSTYTHTTVSSPDIVYSPSTGRIRFRTPGDYLIFACINVICGSNTSVSMAIEHNDTAVYTTSDLDVRTSTDAIQAEGHIIVSVSKNDSVRVRIDGASAVAAQKGSHFMVLKANGDYANAFYVTDSTDQTDDTYSVFNSSEGGQVNSKTSGVAYTAANGKFTPSATRKFLTISTHHYQSDTNRSNLEHTMMRGSSDAQKVDYALVTQVDPLTHTIGFAHGVSDTTYVAIVNTGTAGDTYTIKKGTCLTMLDISNGGTDPSSFLSFSTTKASNALSNSSGEKDVFHQDNYGSSTITKSDRLTATGITYTASNGKLTVSESGIYLILLNLAVKSVTTTGSPVLSIRKNDSEFYATRMNMHTAFDPTGWTAMLLADLNAADYINVIVTSLGGTLDEHGSSITMIKIDETGSSRDVYAQQDASGSVGDDYTLKTFDREVAGFQSDNLLNHQIPFSKGIAGPRNLRGRTTAYAPSLGAKTKK